MKSQKFAIAGLLLVITACCLAAGYDRKANEQAIQKTI
jgi:hypothetical protein